MRHCDQDVYKRGTVIVNLGILKAEKAEQIVNDFRNLLHRLGYADVCVDWHYIGGRAVVKVLASPAEIEAARALLPQRSE